jgi:ubiquinone biosynthesis protein
MQRYPPRNIGKGHNNTTSWDRPRGTDTIQTEKIYIQEGHSAEYFVRFFEEDRTIHIPKIIWESTRVRVITMERIRGIGILDIQSLDKAGFFRKELAR